MVCSDDRSVRKIPEEISGCTIVEHFSAEDDLSKSILSNDNFKKALGEISEDTSLDKLTDLGICILGCWESCNQKNIPLQYIYKKIKEVSNNTIVLKGYTAEIVSEDCREILKMIGVTFQQKGNLFQWKCGTLKGSMAWTAELDAAICEAKPKDVFGWLQIIHQY